MLDTFRAELTAYINSVWARRIFVWSAIAILGASLALVLMVGFGSHNGGSGTAGTKVATILTLVVALPAILLLNLVIALVWAALCTARRMITG